MNIFIIPSWYPNTISQISGIFFKEQALAIGECRPDWKIAISVWGQKEHAISLSRLYSIIPLLVKYYSTKRENSVRLIDNVIEYRKLVLEWQNTQLDLHHDGPLRASKVNLKRAMAEFGTIDLIHAHVSYPAGWIAMQLSKETGIPYVITEHMGPFPFQPYLKRDGTLHKKLQGPLENAGAIIAVSPSLATRIRSFGIENVTYIPNLVDERFFAPKLKTRNNYYYIFFTLGIFIKQKGIPDLLVAIKKFYSTLSLEDQSRVKFRIGGDGPEKEYIYKLAFELGLDGKIEWLGLLSRESALQEFQNCNCFVLTSRHETFGVVCAEAIACGKPLIATRCGGPEAIITPENGLLVEVGDSDQITLAMTKMFNSSQCFNQNVIRSQFLKNFSREAVVSKLEEIYKKVVQ